MNEMNDMDIATFAFIGLLFSLLGVVSISFLGDYALLISAMGAVIMVLSAIQLYINTRKNKARNQQE